MIAAAGIFLTAATAMPAFAQLYRKNNTAASPSEMPKKAHMASTTAERAAAQMTRMTERANAEIDQRIGRLNALSSRIQGMKKVSDTDKASIKATIDGEVTRSAGSEDVSRMLGSNQHLRAALLQSWVAEKAQEQQ